MATRVQNHIHLASSLGGAPENAPIYKWAITAYDTQPTGFWSFDYATDGTLHVHVLEDAGEPVILEDYRASIFCNAEYGFTIQERIAQLKLMRGKFVYLVETYHPDNGEDHTPKVRLMFMDEVKGEEPIDPLITFAEVKVSLIDASRLAS